MSSKMKRCEQCGRSGVRGFKVLPAVELPPRLGGGMTQPITLCVARKACQKRWPKNGYLGPEC
jgi:hypothetical protein